MILALVPNWWAASNSDICSFHFSGKSSCTYLIKLRYQGYPFLCLQPIPPPLPSKTPPPPPPKTTRKQASIDSGIVQWTKMLTVGPNNTLTTQQKQHRPPPRIKESSCFLPTHSSLPVLAWQDEYLTAACPFLSSCFVLFCFFSFLVLTFVFWRWCSLQQGACCTEK